jgi:hypothetical protein
METQNKTLLVYRVFSGTVYEIPEKDMTLLDIGQVPLKKRPPTNCKKCFGKLDLGRDNQNYAYIPCSCLRKVINFDILKSLENINITK